MADTPTPKLPGVATQEGALVGDENLPEPREVESVVEQRQDDAQVVAKAGPPVDKVEVFEVVVTTDEVITDPSSPLAVQIPDAGRGSLNLPIHAFVGARTVEDIFSEDASENEDDSSDEPDKV